MHPVSSLPAVTRPSGVVENGCVTPIAERQDWVVRGPASITFDFGEELPAWFEIEPIGAAPPHGVRLGVSEHLGPMRVNTGAPSELKIGIPEFDAGHLRLVLNVDLIEGVRFGTVYVDAGTILRFRDPRLVGHPVTMTSATFRSGNVSFDAIWDAGARTLRNHVRRDHVSAILVDRGDRFAWALDYFCAQKTLLTVFGEAELAEMAVDALRGIDHGIFSYRLYWVLSVIELVEYTDERRLFDAYRDECTAIVTCAADQFDDLPQLVYVGIDERLGGAFEEPDLPEARRFVQALIVDTVRRLADLQDAMGGVSSGSALRALALRLTETVRSSQLWPAGWGTLSLSQAIVAGIPDAFDRLALLDDPRWLSDSVFSPSPSVQLIVLDALSALDLHDRVDEVIKDYWAAQLTQGATNFMECFRPFWATDLARNEAPPCGVQGVTSLSHAWGSAISAWLSRHNAGVVARHGLDVQLAHWVPNSGFFVGSIRTPQGAIEVVRDGDGCLSNVTAPAPMRLRSVGLTTLRTSQQAECVTHLPRAVVQTLTRLDLETRLSADVVPLAAQREQDLSRAPWFVRSVTVSSGAFDDRTVASGPFGVRSESARWDRFTFTIDVEFAITGVMRVGLLIDSGMLSTSQSVEFFDLETREPIDQGSIVRSDGLPLVVSVVARRSVRIRCGHHSEHPAAATAIHFSDW